MLHPQLFSYFVSFDFSVSVFEFIHLLILFFFSFFIHLDIIQSEQGQGMRKIADHIYKKFKKE